jgi:hypothetical protein
VIWLAVAAAAPLDPFLADLALPADADVSIDRGAERWTITVGDRRFGVAPPTTPEDEQALRALVSSLWTDLDLLPLARLPSPPPLPPPPVPRPKPQVLPPDVVPAEPEAPLIVLVPLAARVEPPPPPPPPEPPVVPPVEVSPARVTIGTDLVVRDRLWPSAGAWASVTTGVRGGVGGRVGGRLPHTTGWGPSTRLSEAYADVLLWTRPTRAIGLVAGIGVAGRWYSANAEPVAAHALPRASTAVSFPVDVGPVELALGAGLECDLLSTSIGFPDDLQLLSPIAGRIDIQVSFEPVRGIPTSYR